MYLHIGNNKNLRTREMIGIFDLDTASTQPDTKELLKESENNALLIYAGYELPKSFIVTETGEIYLSQFSARVLQLKAQRLVIS